MDDVLLTGVGVLSCLGSGVDAFWEGLNKADSLPTRVPDPHADMPYPLMYLVPEADLPTGPKEQDGLPLGRGSQYAIEAARQAVADAGLVAPGAGPAAVDPRRVAVSIGTGMGDARLQEEQRVSGAAGAAGDRWAPTFSVASVVGGWFGAQGANSSCSNACAASGYSLSVAADLIRAGEADVVIAGGAESYSRVALACFNRLGAIDPDRCRPFAAERKGTLFGEGAAVMVLESAEHARRRGVKKAYARLAGAGWSCDAHHATAPEPAGEQIERAMRQAMDEAGARPGPGGGVGFVVAHGTGTGLNDVVESQVLTTVLGEEARTPVYAPKAVLGHTGGAAGAFSALTAALILHHGSVPPNPPMGALDPECAIHLPTDAPTPLSGTYGLINAYAFGGNNVTLVLGEATL
ncbi:beta-ketoacyl-[acyl-carrier-protein] synthase family protein [Streptomyces palmae]|uniref:Beta-ketoacyl-[acyl-carrier-protein] synthase family protein n=1 Tax=Streptomyces palmae TaxID=1701085 RepID=A0A4Z0HDB8_9ACTN|nr:beta-ketoacyl-[acyl-carrier-protein] synthase family protein [Streptomyces palmae]TGB10571.1 beta-ketoacyl-[acyl-carrier-protein] synthase family protein [Streptomyces palmae]